ncbi:MAG: hypothetical protein ACQKBV_09215 [Puniceicoccales bacterium]
MNVRQFYQRMTLREKLLLTSFVWVILLVFFAFALRDFRGVASEWSSTGSQLKVQKDMLALAPEIESQLQIELEFFNSDRTYDSASLAGRVDQLAQQTGINLVNFTTRSQESNIYVLHIMRLTIRDTPLKRLMAFDDALDKEQPYINQVSVSLDANRRNEELLDASIIIKSFELKPGGFAAAQ